MRFYGAKKGGRVHWLLWHLSVEFKANYKLYYNYFEHNYLFYRQEGRKIRDLFVVIQSSKHYWKVMYVNLDKCVFRQFGYKNTRIISEIMIEIFKEHYL